jgi:hypothetical protein
MKKAKTQGLPKANLERALTRVSDSRVSTLVFIFWIQASAGPENSGHDAYYEIMTNDKVGLMVLVCITHTILWIDQRIVDSHFVTDNPARARQALNKIVKDNECIRFPGRSIAYSFLLS